jgi:hypothetical protein
VLITLPINKLINYYFTQLAFYNLYNGAMHLGNKLTLISPIKIDSL